jgi:hypothetical protein
LKSSREISTVARFPSDRRRAAASCSPAASRYQARSRRRGTASLQVKCRSGLVDAGIVAVESVDRLGYGMDAIVSLERRRSSRVAAATCGVVLLAAALAWLLFCLTVKPGPGAVRWAHTLIVLMSLMSVPLLIAARRLVLDAMAGGKIVVGEDVLAIFLPRTLRRPIRLSRAVVAGVIVDQNAVSNGDERLRFLLDGDSTYLYSSVGGSALPILSPERAVPNLAIVFEHPLAFSEPRRRIFGAQDFLPLRPLQPSAPARGLLLRVADPVRASLQLARWYDLGRARDALGTLPSIGAKAHGPTGSRRGMALRRPLSREQMKRSTAWPSLPLIGVVLAVVYAGRHASFTTIRELLLLAGVALFLTGGALDMRLHYQERGGRARVMSLGLAATGLMIAIAVTALSITYG